MNRRVLTHATMTLTDRRRHTAPPGPISVQLSGLVFQSLHVMIAEGHDMLPTAPTPAAQVSVPLTLRPVQLDSLGHELGVRVVWEGSGDTETLEIEIELIVVDEESDPIVVTHQLELTSPAGPSHSATANLPLAVVRGDQRPQHST